MTFRVTHGKSIAEAIRASRVLHRSRASLAPAADGAAPAPRHVAPTALRPPGRFAAAAARMQWRINRLRCMTPAEVSHRTFRMLALYAERVGLLRIDAVPEPDLARAARSWVHLDARIDAAEYVTAADRIVEGKYDVFALSGIDLGSPPRWNRDPRTGVEAPLTFGKLIDHRDNRRVGDIKYLWEINRHLHIVTLAQAYAVSGERRYLSALRRDLESWLEACPFGLGPNWSSALEIALRSINWAIAWQFIGGAESPLFRGDDGAQFRRRWLESIYRHQQYIAGNFSQHSSANNHLIGEATGLFVAALTWPYWLQTRAWVDAAQSILEREALLQNAPDGVNREQSSGYQQFTLDLMLIAFIAGRASGRPLSGPFLRRIRSMLEFLASTMDAGGHVPAFGDCDDAVVVRFAPAPQFSRHRSLLATGALLFQRSDFKAKAGALDDKTRWLFGAGADAAYEVLGSVAATQPIRRAFPCGGYYILGCHADPDDEIHVIVDAGPLGYQTIAAHGHADALAFTLSLGGMEFFVDPGTYAYHTHKPWRDYFRGTSAHNTVRIDGVDQSQPGGNFMWLRKATARCELWSASAECDVFEGWHDGYRRLSDPVLHRRRIVLDKTLRRILIIDRLEMQRTHDIELNFHCSERCIVERRGNGYLVKQGGRIVTLTLPQFAGGASSLYFGSLMPISGWVSRRFDVKMPAPTICWRARATGSCVLRTRIDCP